MRLLVIRRTEFKPLGHVKASAGGIALKRRCILYQGRRTFFTYKEPTHGMQVVSSSPCGLEILQLGKVLVLSTIVLESFSCFDGPLQLNEYTGPSVTIAF